MVAGQMTDLNKYVKQILGSLSAGFDFDMASQDLGYTKLGFHAYCKKMDTPTGVLMAKIFPLGEKLDPNEIQSLKKETLKYIRDLEQVGIQKPINYAVVEIPENKGIITLDDHVDGIALNECIEADGRNQKKAYF